MIELSLRNIEKYKVFEILRSAFEEVLDVRGKIVQLENKMQILQGKSLENAISKYGELQGKFEHMGGYDIDTNIKYICMGLKIDEDMKERTFSTLSGGEKTIILLGSLKILLID
ncbi:hypothetical protein G9F72_008875 [Clostridium estertheticum]|uniref:hypothetical protein n=1 Tax=Clostridium estertheticum TaxID=238834 RepID=UPI0013E9426E|nr:hypothetical protein [Clostridium estertheticum]MBZ9686441.1 hypothetical protein [Clostridium estertheticum]